MSIFARATLVAALLAGAPPALHAESGGFRPEIGKPLTKAKSLLAARRYAEAMAQVRAADNVRNKSADESFVIAQMRGAIAQASGDVATAAKVYQDLLASGRLSGAEQLRLLTAEASIAYQLKNYPLTVEWINKYLKAGGNAADMRTLLITAYYQQGDYANAVKLQSAAIAGFVKARQIPPEQGLQLLANSQDKLGDKLGFQNTMLQLVFYYPKPDYWLGLIHAVQTRPGFNDRLSLDVQRLQLAVGLLTKPAEYMEMAELALQAPLPGEAKAIMDAGYKAGLLGTGPEAPRQQRLRDLIAKTAATDQAGLNKLAVDAATDKNGNRLLAVGEDFVAYGQFDKGLPAMEQAIKLDQLRHPEDAKLHLGIAYFRAGQKAKALQVFRTVGGKDGTFELARLWLVYASKA